MTTYYIDSNAGSNSNSGTSADKPLQSLAAASQLKLKAGDTVLLARGSTFTETLKLTASGDADNPITIGAYGTGEPPVLSGPMAIHGSKASNIVVQDIAIANTTQTAIYAGNVSNWTIDNITMSGTGTVSGIGSIVFKSSDGITVKNSSFDHVTGDAVYIQGSSNIKIIDNTVTNIQGHSADGFQVNDGANLLISGNVVDQTTSANSTKGGIMINNVKNVVVSENVLTGGGFGIAANGWNVEIIDNIITDQTKYTWSSAVIIGGEMDLSDYVVSGNQIGNANFGISLTGLAGWNYSRENITITDNVFVDIVKTALKIDATSTGSFEGNVVVNSKPALLRWDGIADGFDIKDNNVMTTAEAEAMMQQKPGGEVATPPVPEPAPAPVATPEPVSAPEPVEAPAPVVTPAPVLKAGANLDTFTLGTGSTTISGNILANDIAVNSDAMLLRTVGSSRMTGDSIDVKGLYGTLHIESDGDFTYALNEGVHLNGAKSLLEKFQYKAADGAEVDVSKLIIDITAHVAAQDHLLL